MAQISFFKPSLFRKDMDAVLQTMVDEKIGPGEKKRAFVKAYADYIGLRDGVALRSYIDAIAIALKSLGLGEGDTVALSVFTPQIYLDAFKRIAIKPLLVDVDDDMMPSLAALGENLESIKAVVLFEPLGNFVADGEGYRELGVPVIEDITQAVGSVYSETKPGKTGNIVIASTEEDSLVSTAGGAIILSDNEETVALMKKEINPYIELPDMNAALGIVQLAKLGSIVQRRSSIYKIYLDEARRRGRVKVFGSSDLEFKTNGYGFSCVTNDRPDEVIEMAKKYSVTVRKTFSSSVGARYQDRYDRFPKAFEYLSRGVSFPLYPFLSNAEIQTVQKVIGILR